MHGTARHRSTPHRTAPQCAQSADRDEVISELENLKAKNHIMMEDDQMRLRNRFVQRAIYGMMLNSQATM